MKLRNSLSHMRNSKVRVNGNTYKIIEGIIDIDDETGISYLLQNSAWSRVSVVNRSPLRKPMSSLSSKIDFSKMKKDELVTFLNYKQVQFDPNSKKADLLTLAQQLGE